jgi:hypothetical protein
MQIISVDSAEDLVAWQREYGPESVYVMHDPDYTYEEGEDEDAHSDCGYCVRVWDIQTLQGWMDKGTIYGVVIP